MARLKRRRNRTDSVEAYATCMCIESACSCECSCCCACDVGALYVSRHLSLLGTNAISIGYDVDEAIGLTENMQL